MNLIYVRSVKQSIHIKLLIVHIVGIVQIKLLGHMILMRHFIPEWLDLLMEYDKIFFFPVGGTEFYAVLTGRVDCFLLIYHACFLEAVSHELAGAADKTQRRTWYGTGVKKADS